ncbi:hypothetical protein K1T71_006796 [Dendrolimus kikuchii]|uniref:Uncharacterized protein n=1 Tax=Dendrolimus kikuchii TaxID=765133 RepID=A0ACC1D1V4_9NEOP|nr:hypothetical protein K1T71_006796 [Dendrolimus kikuchii]
MKSKRLIQYAVNLTIYTGSLPHLWSVLLDISIDIVAREDCDFAELSTCKHRQSSVEFVKCLLVISNTIINK